MSFPRPLILIILDGWGYSENTFYNAIHSANKPTWDRLWDQYPHTLLSASGLDAGLPSGQMGNSEVGHLHMGAGRLVDQEFTRINKSIKSGEFFKNPTLVKCFETVAKSGKTVHFPGLLSPGGVHSHETHIWALMEMAARCGVKKLLIHAFLDGRDTLPKSAAGSIHLLSQKIHELGLGEIASLVGRHYAMDRNRNWDRTKLTYDLISQGKAPFRAADPFIALDMAYARNESDEFVQPTAITLPGQPPHSVEDGDAMIFSNYRADRARQIARAFNKKDFKSFPRERKPKLSSLVSLTSYKKNYDFPMAFSPKTLKNTFGEYLAKRHLKQLRIAETEKYAHVTFFFNGGDEHPYDGEDRILVPSPHVNTYNYTPQMSALEVTRQLCDAIAKRKYDAIICNFANADMVGHTGDYDATIKAVETLDHCIKQIHAATCAHGGELLITADHGNAEQMRTYTNEKILSDRHTAHTSNPVPVLYVGRKARILDSEPGKLQDLAPTMLYLMGLPIPKEMTGRCLFELA
ncbi:MAG: 2,3-bisphosphoglycerate-independent phosphoglycerate mutase [Candidatus Eutrophobiaceae bacterium]